MKIHEQDMKSEFFDDIESLKPVITPGNSDSAALDNAFELLVRSGKSIPLVKLMLIPDAWSKRRKTVSKAHQQLFNFLNSTMEPWDGPAAVAFSNGRSIGALLDRNGLRPARYTITRDGFIVMASEKEPSPEQAWSCAILRVVHTITHVDNDLSRYFFHIKQLHVVIYA